MNLSKIAAGVAVSFCLVSNIALADSSSGASSSSKSDKPEKPAVVAGKKEEVKPQDNIMGVSLIDKAKTKFEKDKPRVDAILERLKHKVEGQPNGDVGKKPNPPRKTRQTQKKLEKRWKEEWQKLPEEEKRLILKTYGYYQSYKNLEDWSGSGNRIAAALFSSFDILNEDVNKALYDAEANKKAIDVAQEKNEKSVGDLSKSIEQNKKDINLNKEAIKVNSASITDNRENIQKNKKSIEKNIASIDANKANIMLNHKAIQDVKSQLNSRLDNLNKDLRRGLAIQSALTGLFQPYSVGKMNVTAAVGGYQSEKAIAIGSGYRFNDNFAAKVGLSKSLGGSAVSYNMGVNYEF